MKTKLNFQIKKIFGFIPLVAFSCNVLLAQPWMQKPLLKYQQGKAKQQTSANFYDIQAAFNKYWQGKDITEKGKGWKQFKRWEDFMAPRVYPSGKIENFSARLYTEYQNYKQRNSNMRSHVNAPANWTQIGPTAVPTDGGGAGRLNFITFKPGDNNTIWVGSSSGGLWKTIDGGTTWSTNTDQLANLGSSDLVINPSNTNIMYLATGDCNMGVNGSIGVLKSTDGGATWNNTGLTFTVNQAIRITKLIIHPSTPDILLAATNFGIYRTTDAGANWSNVKTWLTWDLEFKPTDPTVIYASDASGGIFKSIDTGATWTQLTAGLPTSGAARTKIAVTPANANMVYALFTRSDNSGYYGVYRTNDNGTNWTKQSDSPNIFGYSSSGSDTGGIGWYAMVLEVSEVNADVVFVGSVNLWKSTNGGSTWNINAHWYGEGGKPYLHADHHALKFLPGSGTTLFSGNDGGIFKTTDAGVAWSDKSNGLAIKEFYRIGISSTNTNLMLGGAQDNGTDRYSAGAWKRVIGGDGMECLIDYSDNNIMYGEYQYGNLFRSNDGGTSFPTNIKPAGTNGDWITPFVIHPTTPATLFAAYQDVYRTTDRGANWTKISNFNTILNSLAVAPSNANVIYTGTGNTLYKTNDGGTNWTNITTGLPNLSLTYICVHPTDPNTCWVTFSGYSNGFKVYKTIDGGANWSNISGTLPNIPVNCIVYQNNSSNALYIGTDLGVFYINSSLTDWVVYDENLPNVIVKELEIFYPTGKLRAATYGRGIWESPLCQPPATPGSITGLTSVNTNQTGVGYSISAVTGATSYSWTVPSGASVASGQGTASITVNFGTTSGNITVTASNGCGVSAANSLSVSVTAPAAYCSGSTDLTASSASFSDGSGTNDYKDNSDCKWVIKPAGATSITLSFSSFATEASYDFVKVYNGATTSDPLLGTFHGTSLPSSVTSGGTMLVHFTSDGSVVAAGWNASYTSVSTFCSGSTDLTASSGSFSDGSGTNNYKDNSNCKWVIKPTGVTSITLSFSAFATELNYDFVKVYNGATTSDPLLGSFSGTSLPSSITSGGSMLVHFTSDGSVVAAGWSASYTSSTKYCSGSTDLTASEGSFTDGSGSNNYADNSDCKWVIKPAGAKSITLSFSSFATEANYDFVKVYNGATTSDPLLGSFSGTSLPSSITSGGTMLVHFTSDGSVTAAGWNASYVSPCSGTTNLTSSTGSFSDGSGTSDYQNNMNCTWIIDVAGAASIGFTFTAFNTEASYDFVKVYQWSPSTANYTLVKSYHGNLASPFSVTANSGKAKVTFTSDGSVVKSGWALNYAANLGMPKSLTGIDNADGNLNGITIYPNPTEGKFMIDLALQKEQDVFIEVYNGISQNIKQLHLENVIATKQEIDLNQQQAGLYFVKIQTNEGVTTQKIILTK